MIQSGSVRPVPASCRSRIALRAFSVWPRIWAPNAGEWWNGSVASELIGVTNIGVTDTIIVGRANKWLRLARMTTAETARPADRQADLADQPDRGACAPAAGRDVHRRGHTWLPLPPAGRAAGVRARQPGQPGLPQRHRPQRRGGRPQRTRPPRPGRAHSQSGRSPPQYRHHHPGGCGVPGPAGEPGGRRSGRTARPAVTGGPGPADPAALPGPGPPRRP